MSAVLSHSHLDRPVALAVRDGREVVIKTYLHGGSQHVHDDMLQLWQSPFGRDRRTPGLPQPLSVDPSTGEVVMARAPGRPLGERGDPGDSVRRLPEVAALLADLHDSGVTVRRVRSAAQVIASSQRKAAALCAACATSTDGEPPSDVGATSARAVAAAVKKVVMLMRALAPQREALVPSHGDFSPRNILGDPTGLVLIDMDRMQMADPAHDLAYWGSWTWATEVMSDRVPSWQVLGDLVSHYVEYLGGRSRVTDQSLAFHQAAGLVRIVHGWSALQSMPSVQLRLLDEATRLLDPCTTRDPS